MKKILLFIFLLSTSYSYSQTVMYKIANVFIGNYSEEQVKTTLEKAMKMYNMPINDDNRLKAASCVLSLRKYNKDKFSEMQILEHMIKSNNGKRLSFPDQAGLSSTLLLRQ
uniref:hypothetical protein n=1 Tax=Emticicia sp. TaxID=1930953 RepID=UPI0037537FD0